MKYLKSKCITRRTERAEAITPEAPSRTEEESKSSKISTPKWNKSKAKNPYAITRTTKRTNKLEEQRQEGGDVQVKSSKGSGKSTDEQEDSRRDKSGNRSVTRVSTRDQQTLAKFVTETDPTDLIEVADHGPSQTDVFAEAEGADASYSRKRSAPKESDPGSTASSERGGFRQWHQSMLSTLTRARRCRDIRLNREEVLQMQMLIEAVLNQYLTLSRDVETVKSSLEKFYVSGTSSFESGSDPPQIPAEEEVAEPMALRDAEMELERHEESTLFARYLAAKDEEIHRLKTASKATVRDLINQMATLAADCKAKEEELNRVCAVISSQKAELKALQLHVQALRERQEEELDCKNQEREVLSEQLNNAEVQVDELNQAVLNLNMRVEELSKDAANREAEISLKKVVDEKEMVISKLKTELAAVESRNEIESMSLSRALTEKETHIRNLMEKMDEHTRDHAAEISSLRSTVDNRDRIIDSLRAQLQDKVRNALEGESDYESHVLSICKAFSAVDDQVARLKKDIEEQDKHAQELEKSVEILRSQKDVDSISFNAILNEKDIQISNLVINMEDLKVAIASKDASFVELSSAHTELQTAYDQLLKSIEAMNSDSEHKGFLLKQTFDQLEVARRESERKSDELDRVQKHIEEQKLKMEKLKKAVDDAKIKRDTDAAHFREALHEKDLEIREIKDHFQKFRAERKKEESDLKSEIEYLSCEKSKLQRSYDGTDEAIRTLERKLNSTITLKEDLEISLYEKESEVKILQNSASQMKVAHKERQAAIKMECEQKASEIASLNKQIKSLKAAVKDSAQKTKEIETLKKSLEKGHESLLEVTRKHEGCQKKLETKNSEIERLLRTAQQNETALKHLKKQLDEREQAESKQLEKMKQDLKLQKSTSEKYAVTVKDLESRLKVAEKDIESKTSLLKVQEIEMEKLNQKSQSEIANLREELGHARIKTLSLKTNICRCFKAIKSLIEKRALELENKEKELQSAKENINDMQQTIHRFTADKRKAEKTLLYKETEAKQLRDSVERFQTKEREMENQIASLSRDLKMKCRDLQEKEETMTSIQQESLKQAEENTKLLETLKLELEVEKNLVKHLTEEHRAKVKKLTSALENFRSEADAEISALKAKISQLESETVETRKEGNTLKTVCGNLTLEIQGYQKAITDLNLNKAAQDQALLEKQDYCSRLADQLGCMNSEIERLKGSLSKKETELQNIKKAADRKDIEKNSGTEQVKVLLSAEIDRKQIEISQLKIENEQTTQELNSLKNYLAQHRKELNDVVYEKDNQISILQNQIKCLEDQALRKFTQKYKLDLRELEKARQEKDVLKKEVEKVVKNKDKEMESLKVELAIQRQILTTMKVGRAFLDVPSEHETSRGYTAADSDAKFLRATTEQTTILSQDGDHLTPSQLARKCTRKNLKRTASEGDHLDDWDRFDGWSTAECPSDANLSTATQSGVISTLSSSGNLLATSTQATT